VCMIFIVHTISRNQQPLKMGSPDVHGRSRFAKLSIHDDSKV
jgi:hypothetical protein